MFLSLSDTKVISLEVVSLKELMISSSKSSNFVELKNLSSSICFFEILFKISLHLLDWLISRSISLDRSLLFPISFFNSLATTVIVAKGVPRECAAAAACPPKDSNSYSL